MTRWERLLGIVLGLILGIAIVIAFVFFGSERTVDAPSIDHGAKSSSAAQRESAH